MSRIVQYFADKARSIKEYPITLIKAIYSDDGKRLDTIMDENEKKLNEVLNDMSTKQFASSEAASKFVAIDGAQWTGVDATYDGNTSRFQLDANSNLAFIYRKLKGSTAWSNELISTYYTAPAETDILDFAISQYNNRRMVRVYNGVNSPGTAGDNDFFYDIMKADSNWIHIVAYDVRTRFAYQNTRQNGTWLGWAKIANDGTTINPSWVNVVNAGTVSGTEVYLARNGQNIDAGAFYAEGNTAGTNVNLIVYSKIGNINLLTPAGKSVYMNGKEIATKADFQAGVDKIYNLCASAGSTPASKALADVQAAMQFFVDAQAYIPDLANCLASAKKAQAAGYSAFGITVLSVGQTWQWYGGGGWSIHTINASDIAGYKPVGHAAFTSGGGSNYGSVRGVSRGATLLQWIGSNSNADSTPGINHIVIVL